MESMEWKKVEEEKIYWSNKSGMWQCDGTHCNASQPDLFDGRIVNYIRVISKTRVKYDFVYNDLFIRFEMEIVFWGEEYKRERERDKFAFLEVKNIIRECKGELICLLASRNFFRSNRIINNFEWLMQFFS